MVAPVRIGQPLVFVHDQQLEGGPCPYEIPGWWWWIEDTPGSHAFFLEAALHRLQGCHDHRRIRREGDIAGHDAHLPATGAPFGELVVRKGPGWYGEKGSTTEVRLLQPPFKNVGFPRSCRGIDDHVAPGFQRLNSLGLPAIR